MIRDSRRAAVFAVLLLGTACSREYDPNAYLVTPTAVGNIISLTSSLASVPADGVSTMIVTAKIDPQSTKRDVTFTASDGSFTIGAQSDTKKATVTADSSGTATTELRSSTTVGTVIVDATLTLDATHSYRQAINVGFSAPDTTTLLTLTASSTTGQADGATTIQLTATVPAALRSRSVTFTVNDGTFDDGTKSTMVTADSSNRAVVDLKAPTQATIVHARAAVSTFSADATITYSQALPETILVSPAKVQVSSTSTDVITTSLFRGIGVPSAGLVPTYSATDPNGNTIGGFSNLQPTTTTTSPPGGTATVTYDPASTAFRGQVTIKVTVGNLVGTTTVTVTP